MNILYHHRTRGTGAEGVHIAYIIKGLRGLGHTLDVVSPGDVDPVFTAGNNPFASLNNEKKNFMLVLTRKMPQIFFEFMELAYNCAAYLKIKKALGKKKYQMIYERQSFFCMAGAFMAGKNKIPYIVEVNEVAGEKRVRKQTCVRLAKKIERYVFKKADAIIVVSEFLKAKIHELGIEQDKIFVIPNGVDEKLFDPSVECDTVKSKLGIEGDTVVIGFIGWFVAWHQLDQLIKVTAQLSGRHDIRLMLVGDGSLKIDLEKLAEQEGIREKVIFPGAVKYASIPEHIKAMDICVIPASNEYRSPIKLFEYMAMEKATVAPRFKAIADVIGENEFGLLFHPGNAEDLKRVLEQLIENPDQRRALGLKARERITRNFLWTHNARKVMRIHEDIRRKQNFN